MPDRIIALVGPTVSTPLAIWTAVSTEAASPTIVIFNDKLIDTMATNSASLIGHGASCLADYLNLPATMASQSVYRPGEAKANDPWPYIEVKASQGTSDRRDPLLMTDQVMVGCFDRPPGGVERVERMMEIVKLLLHNSIFPDNNAGVLCCENRMNYPAQQYPNYGFGLTSTFRVIRRFNA